MARRNDRTSKAAELAAPERERKNRNSRNVSEIRKNVDEDGQRTDEKTGMVELVRVRWDPTVCYGIYDQVVACKKKE